MACAFEALGISAGGSAMVPAEDDDKGTVAERIGELVLGVLADDVRPSKVITRDSLENAIACVCASGGSTNAVLHLIALAHELGIDLTMADFERISRATPLYADLKPGGRFVATDLYAAGGVPVILKRLADSGNLHSDALTVTGKTIGEVASRSTTRSSSKAAWPYWAATWRPKGPW
jgi:dihydroxy-acid dehydratase